MIAFYYNGELKTENSKRHITNANMIDEPRNLVLSMQSDKSFEEFTVDLVQNNLDEKFRSGEYTIDTMYSKFVLPVYSEGVYRDIFYKISGKDGETSECTFFHEGDCDASHAYRTVFDNSHHTLYEFFGDNPLSIDEMSPYINEFMSTDNVYARRQIDRNDPDAGCEVVPFRMSKKSAAAYETSAAMGIMYYCRKVECRNESIKHDDAFWDELFSELKKHATQIDLDDKNFKAYRDALRQLDGKDLKSYIWQIEQDLIGNFDKDEPLTLRHYTPKTIDEQMNLVNKWREEIIEVVCDMDMAAVDALSKLSDKPAPENYYGELSRLSSMAKDFELGAPHGELLLKLDKMRPIERKLLAESGFQGLDMIEIIDRMLPEVKGQPRYTADYNNYLHSLDGFNRSTMSDYYPNHRECKAYKYPALKKMLEEGDEYTLSDLGFSQGLSGKELDRKLQMTNTMVEDGLDGIQIGIISRMHYNAVSEIEYDICRELTYKYNGSEVGRYSPVFFLENPEGDEKLAALQSSMSEETKNILKALVSGAHECPSNKAVAAIQHNMYLHATDQPEQNIKPVILEELKSGSWKPYKSVKNNEVEKMFKDKYKFVPKCTGQIKDMVAEGYMSAADAVNNFDRRKIQEFAELSNPAMIRLTYEMDTKTLTDKQKEVLECYATKKNIDGLIDTIGVRATPEAKEWSKEYFSEFVKGANYISNNEEIKGMIGSDSSLGRKEQEKVLKKVIEEARAADDIKAYEEDYKYSFKDNEILIKGADTRIEGKHKTATILPADDPRNFTVGYDTSCCQHYDGAGESCTYYATSHPDSAIWVIEEKDKVVAQAFIWTDAKSDTFVFDNIEFANDRDTNEYLDILHKYAESLPYKNVHMGTGYNQKSGDGIIARGSGDCHLQEKELCPVPKYDDGDGKIEVYSDYHSDAVVLKRNGKMTFESKHPDQYHDATYSRARKEVQSNNSRTIDIREAYKRKIHASAMGFGSEADYVPLNRQILKQG